MRVREAKVASAKFIFIGRFPVIIRYICFGRRTLRTLHSIKSNFVLDWIFRSLSADFEFLMCRHMRPCKVFKWNGDEKKKYNIKINFDAVIFGPNFFYFFVLNSDRVASSRPLLLCVCVFALQTFPFTVNGLNEFSYRFCCLHSKCETRCSPNAQFKFAKMAEKLNARARALSHRKSWIVRVFF